MQTNILNDFCQNEGKKKHFLKNIKQLETTKADQEPIKTHQEPTRNRPGINQNHARMDQETSSLLRLFVPAHE